MKGLTELTLLKNSRVDLFANVGDYLKLIKLNVADMDDSRPWGGFFVIDENQVDAFCREFFPGLEPAKIGLGGKLSPKLLIVQPGKRLSWQYHNRRAERWRVVSGRVSVVTSDTNEEHDPLTLETGDCINLFRGQRHRLIGMEEWGVVAEIWQHTDADHPSDENDIIRVQDDFGR